MALARTAVEDAARYARSWVEYRQRTQLIPGVSFAIAHDGDLVASHAIGKADVERDVHLRTDHTFRIASHSKTFTATAVMLLVERGRLRLDDRVSQHVAWLDDGDAGIGVATLRELLSHSAGVIRDGEDAPWWQLRGPFLDPDGLRQLATTTPPVIERNERFKYSNIGFALLGEVIAAVAGEPYDAFVRREIVDRLGLSSTDPEPALDDPRLATGYTARRYGFDRRPLPHRDTRAMAAATGFSSTAEDLCRYGAAQFLGNDELLTDASKREMQHGWWEVKGGRGGHYGLGFQAYTIGGRRVISHGGSFPGFITFTAIDPVDRLVVSVLTNAHDGPAETIATAIVRLVDRAQRATADDAVVDAERQAQLDRCTGRFFSLSTVTDVVRLGGDLVAIDPELLNPVTDASRLELVGPDLFRIAETAGAASFGERVRFERSSSEPDAPVRAVQFAGSRLLPLDEHLAELDRVAARP